MRFLLGVVLALSIASQAGATVTVRTPVEDVGFPFWCAWGYDWDERCYRDFGLRLPVGGVDDKVWRSGLRFSLAGIPPGARVASARLELTFDEVCVAPRLEPAPCPPGARYLIEAYPIASTDWYHEREPEYYWVVEDEVWLDTTAGRQAVGLELTGLTRSWLAGELENDGVLLKLADGWEDFGSSGPYFPSAEAADSGVRPRLVITYSSPTGAAR
jgi:hypothetical protein